MFNILLQCKFFLVEFLNISYQIIPNPIRTYYLRLFHIRLGEKTFIHRRVKFFHVGNLVVGKNSVVNFGCYLDNRRGIYIGNNVGIAHNTKIYTLGHDLNDLEFKTKGSSVNISNNVFIFSNSIIMPGVSVGEGAIILAGSVVVKNVEPWSIVGGNPARFIRNRNKDVDYKQIYGYWFAL